MICWSGVNLYSLSFFNFNPERICHKRQLPHYCTLTCFKYQFNINTIKREHLTGDFDLRNIWPAPGFDPTTIRFMSSDLPIHVFWPSLKVRSDDGVLRGVFCNIFCRTTKVRAITSRKIRNFSNFKLRILCLWRISKTALADYVAHSASFKCFHLSNQSLCPDLLPVLWGTKQMVAGNIIQSLNI